MPAIPLLTIENLSLTYQVGAQRQSVFHKANLQVQPGEVVGIMGPSGSGKTTLTKVIFNEPQARKAITHGRVLFHNTDLLQTSHRERLRLYGNEIALISQEPALAFNPVKRIGQQVMEAALKHRKGSKGEIERRLQDWLKKTHLDTGNMLLRYPHQLSGGQLQRLMIVSAVLLEPKLLIADEPTTSLDPTNQKEILDLLLAINHQLGTALLLIGHDPYLMRYVGAQIYLLNNAMFQQHSSPTHMERISNPIKVDRDDANLVLEVREMSAQIEQVPILHQIGFRLYKGEAVGILGQSGAGKTTLAKALLGFVAHTGQVFPIHAKGQIQMVFQHPGASLDPRQGCMDVVLEALTVSGNGSKSERPRLARQLLDAVGLDPNTYQLKPYALSGGQKQRLCIARALAARPQILICDEAVSSLDDQRKTEIMALLITLAKTMHLSLLVISHDVSVLRHLCGWLIFMASGKVVEQGPTETLVTHPQSDELKALLSACLSPLPTLS